MVTTCITCGCSEYTERHPGTRSLVWSDIQAAAKDAGITPKAAAWNIVKGTNAMTEQTSKAASEFAAFLSSIEQDGRILKSQDERRFLLTVVYSPHRMPLRGADKKIDLASPEVLEDACWKYAMNGLGAGMWHEPGHENEAVCVENQIYRGPDWTLKDAKGNEVTIKAGDWLAGYILSPHAWDLYKSDQIGGVSMQGGAGRKKASPEAISRVRSES